MKRSDTKSKRAVLGRGLFYSRDSGGKHETTPGEYVRWANGEAERLGVTFTGSPDDLESMIREGRSRQGDLYFDAGVTGNKLSRRGLDAMIQAALFDKEVTHVFIPRRDRFARPDDPADAIKLENLLRSNGLTLVFMDRVVAPQERGRRRDLGEMIVALIDYESAGEFRRELAQKMLFAQRTLARAGFSTGGRPPYGFRRWLVTVDGKAVRQLAEGERVRMPGHHVAWLPGPDSELVLIRRILTMLETMPASRIAAILTKERIPTPDSNRSRTDGGVKHRTSGVWHQNTVTGIARNPLLLAMMSYGRRSMGDQLRFAPDGQRGLVETDFRGDGQPKVVVNRLEDGIVSPAKFEPLVDVNEHQALLEELDRRSGGQRGKARSRSPELNPLGCRVFDMRCGWPMYRVRCQSGFRHKCGLYMQSHAAECHHNHVDGPTAARFVLGCIRQRVLSKSCRDKLESRLRDLARSEQKPPGSDRSAVAAKRAALAELGERRETIARNLALATNQDQFKAIAEIYDKTGREEESLRRELLADERSITADTDIESEIEEALADFDRLSELASDSTQLGPIGELFNELDARLFLRFEEVQLKKRKMNKIVGGVVTFGASEPPIKLYEGPTGRRALGSKAKAPDETPGAPQFLSVPTSSDREGNSLGNVSRGDRI